MNLIVPGILARIEVKHGGDAELHGRVHVVAAGMHHTHILSQVAGRGPGT